MSARTTREMPSPHDAAAASSTNAAAPGMPMAKRPTAARASAGKVRFGITLKMFLAVLGACLLVSLTMGYAIRVSFENGFLHYVRDRDLGRVKALTARLLTGYANNGNWDFLRNHPDAWIALLDAAREDSRRQDAADALNDRSSVARIGALASWRSFPGSGTVHQLLDPLSPAPGHRGSTDLLSDASTATHAVGTVGPVGNAQAGSQPAQVPSVGGNTGPHAAANGASASAPGSASSATAGTANAALSHWGIQMPRTGRDAPILLLSHDLPSLQAGDGDATKTEAGGASGKTVAAVGATAAAITAAAAFNGHGVIPLPPVTLLDADKHLVATTLYGVVPESSLKPIFFDGKVVGWLSANGSDALSDAADIAFQAQQMRSTLQIALIAVVVAALVALLLARVVLAPVKRLMGATHRLANGDFTVRVPAGRRDELDRLAGDFNMLADSLQKAERTRRDFLADISHELRTPLAVLRGELEAIEDGVHSFNRDSLTSLQTEVTMLNAIIEDLYELSLSDVGALSYRKAPADVGQLASTCVEAFREGFKAKRIALQLRMPPARSDAAHDAKPAPMIFEVDPGRFTQLLKNLLQNSLRYTDPGGRVEVTLSSRPGHGWRLDVQDSAPGVPAAALPHLFERLYRVDESRSRQSGGAGLGLALCHAIVAAHGGAITAQPSLLGGVWVSAHFPAERAS